MLGLITIFFLPMFRKNYVSIYFLHKEIQIVQLSSDKKKVKIFATVPLPEGLIGGQEVLDKLALTNIIKNAWKKLEIKERSVFLVIPEFSTFVKTFELAGVEFSDLAEAVSWQVHEYIPKDLDDIIFDWQIVGKNKKTYKILVVALDKSTLSGFVDSVEKAGLFPQVVEIPSLCLRRILLDGQEINLIIYKTLNDIIITAFDGPRLLASSVIRDGDHQEFEVVLKSVFTRFKGERDFKIKMGGVNLDKNVTEQVLKGLEVRLESLDLAIEGINKDNIQNYLIPILSCLQEPSEPSDPFSLNLLPAALVERYKRSKLNLQIWGLILTVTLFVSTSFLLTLGVYLVMDQQITSFRQQNSDAFQKIKERQEISKSVEKINSISDRVDRISKVSLPPQIILNEIAQAKAEGINIGKYSLDFDKGIISISGSAIDRNTLLDFKRNLESNPNISQIEIPISSFEKDIDLDFMASFVYLPLVSNKGKIIQNQNPK